MKCVTFCNEFAVTIDDKKYDNKKNFNYLSNLKLFYLNYLIFIFF